MQWLKVSQFGRGAVAAIALLTGVPAILKDYSALDMVAVVHAVIVGWNRVAEIIASCLHRMVGLPQFPPHIVTSLMLASAIGPAWSFTILKSEWGRHKGVVQNSAFGVRALLAFGETVLYSLFIVAAPVGSPLFWLSLFGLTLSISTVLAKISAYRRGFMFSLGVLAIMEGVYLVSTDSFKKRFDSFVCPHQTVSAPRCLAHSG